MWLPLSIGVPEVVQEKLEPMQHPPKGRLERNSQSSIPLTPTDRKSGETLRAPSDQIVTSTLESDKDHKISAV